VDQNTPIGNISNALAQYIIDHPEKFHETIDIVAHSMGGLVVRNMIKQRHPDLVAAGYKIGDVALIATPNHGTWLAEFPYFILGVGVILALILLYLGHLWAALAALVIGIIVSFILDLAQAVIGGVQGEQMKVVFQPLLGNPFLEELNAPDETPYGIDDTAAAYPHLSWSTYRGQGVMIGRQFLVALIWPFDLIDHDGMVGGWSVPLQGARNYGPYQRNHEELLQINEPATADLFYDLFTELTCVLPPEG